jgi:hypothetical protein
LPAFVSLLPWQRWAAAHARRAELIVGAHLGLATLHEILVLAPGATAATSALFGDVVFGARLFGSAPAGVAPRRARNFVGAGHEAAVDEHVARALERGWLRHRHDGAPAPTRVHAIGTETRARNVSAFDTTTEGKVRVIHDLTRAGVNASWPAADTRVAFDDHRVAAARARPGDYAVVVDVQDAYHNLRIAARDVHELVFGWRGRQYELLVLPMGWSRAPVVYHSLQSAVIAHVLPRDRFANFIDDALLFGAGQAAASQAAVRVRDVLFGVGGIGFTESAKTAANAPARAVKFVGIDFNLAARTLALPAAKRVLYASDVARALASPATVSRVVLERIVGRLVHATIVHRSGLLFLPTLYASMADSGRRLFRPLTASGFAEARIELAWWLEQLSCELPRVAHFSTDVEVCTSECATDGALAGNRAAIAAACSGSVVHEAYDVLPSVHIGLVEADAVALALRTWCSAWRGGVVKMHIDNAQLLYALQNRRSAGDAKLARRVRAILGEADAHAITLVPSYVASGANDVADAHTRPSAAARAAALARWAAQGTVIDVPMSLTAPPVAPPSDRVMEDDWTVVLWFKGFSPN